MKKAALILVLASSSALAQEPTVPSPEQAIFAREMLICSQKYVALKLLEPGNSTPTEIVTEARVYSDAASAAAGEAFVEQELPAVRQSALEFVSSVSASGPRNTLKAIDRVKKECDGRLAAHAAGH